MGTAHMISGMVMGGVIVVSVNVRKSLGVEHVCGGYSEQDTQARLHRSRPALG